MINGRNVPLFATVLPGHQSKRKEASVPPPVTANARELLDNASFGPTALTVLGQAFDEAWAIIAGNFGEGPLAVEAARARLAHAILAEAAINHGDIEALKNAALEALIRKYRAA
jgi:hypothetical protein